jgi:hypothetical protein
MATVVAGLQARLDAPLRVAIAGRVKAGKSTLLNALVGERLAPTDARECTRIVTWYGYGEGYDVSAELLNGESRPLPFTREDGRLDIQLDAEMVPQVRRLKVDWPSARLEDMTIIDTPGIGSVTPGVSERTTAALAERQSPSEADAVIYLMRHVHASDVAFLEAFLDEQATQVTPVNSVAVLSRADEIGGGRLGSLQSARVVAARYASDPRIRSLASAVVPVAGLLAETAATLEERDAESLRVLAGEPPEVASELLLSVDHFRNRDVGSLTGEAREELLTRFGLYGVRLALAAFQEGRWRTATDLARLLRAESGIAELEEVLRQRFAGRARQLVARAVLESLRAVIESADGARPSANALLRRIEEVEASAHDIAELRLLDLVWGGTVEFSDQERIEAERVTGEAATAARAGCPPDASADDIRAAAIAGVGRWRERAASVLADRQTSACCETMARTYEGLYAAAGARGRRTTPHDQQ